MITNTFKILASTLILFFGFTACTSEGKSVETTTTPSIAIDSSKKVKAVPKIKEFKPALGIDVSHFQGKINWEEIKANNISFAYTKATEGNYYVDPKFKANWAEMTAAKMAKGAYHFYTTKEDGNTQAMHYINTVIDIDSGDLPPVLDLEQGGLNTDISVEEFQKEVMVWLTTVEQKLGVKPIIYTNNPFANKYLLQPEFATYKLWIAEYGVKEARVPKTWKNKGWSIWQRTESGNIEGEIGNVDHDLTSVSLQSLLVN